MLQDTPDLQPRSLKVQNRYSKSREIAACCDTLSKGKRVHRDRAAVMVAGGRPGTPWDPAKTLEESDGARAVTDAEEGVSAFRINEDAASYFV
jgi:hypothetical protein